MTAVLVTALVLAGLALLATLVRAGADAVTRALEVEARERRSAHWRRLAEAAWDVQRAADGYAGAMSRGAGVADAAAAYQHTARRMALVLASGPCPLRLRPLVAILGDPHRPEDVCATRAGDAAVAELAELQAANAERDLGPSGRPRPRQAAALPRAARRPR